MPLKGHSHEVFLIITGKKWRSWGGGVLLK